MSRPPKAPSTFERQMGAAVIPTREGVKEKEVLDAKTSDAIEAAFERAEAKTPPARRAKLNRILQAEREAFNEDDW